MLKSNWKSCNTERWNRQTKTKPLKFCFTSSFLQKANSWLYSRVDHLGSICGISRQQNLLKILNSHMKTQCLEWLIIVLPWPAFVTVTDSGRNLELIQILSPLITSSLWLKKKVWSCEENLNFLLKLIFLFSFF